MKLTYFPTRGRAEPIRLMLAAKNVSFEDVKINPTDWPKIKPSKTHYRR